MGYELHITRREHWADADGPEIAYFDWLDYLNIDRSLQEDAVFQKEGSEAQERTCVIWTDWSGRKGGKEARLWLRDGNIVTSDADAEFRRKMFVMADVLGAKLQGAKGEIYNSVGEPDSRGRIKPSRSGKRPWWKFW